MTIQRKARRGRPTDKELFLNTLTELSDGGTKLVGNGNLREAIGWDELKYLRIKEQLAREKMVIVGRGRGGSVGLQTAPGAGALRVFISYAREDEEAKTSLVKHLAPLKRMKLIETWDDRQIRPGEKWGDSISKQLEGADLIVLIVSIDFINSEYCYDIEMERALERHEGGAARVIPIIYRNCLWSQAPFAKLQALPKDAMPINSWNNKDDAYVSVVDGLRIAAEELLANR